MLQRTTEPVQNDEMVIKNHAGKALYLFHCKHSDEQRPVPWKDLSQGERGFWRRAAMTAYKAANQLIEARGRREEPAFELTDRGSGIHRFLGRLKKEPGRIG